MPKVLELRVIDNELWCKVGVPGEFENGVSLLTPTEVESKYQEGYRDAMNEIDSKEDNK